MPLRLCSRAPRTMISAPDKYSTEVVLQGFNSSMVLLDSRGDGDQGSNYAPAARQEGGQGNARRPSSNAPAFEPSGFDDDIPF
jgi:single-strand DNA-binding protein